MAKKSNPKLVEPKFDLNTIAGKVEQRLWYMMSLKQHRYWKYINIRNEYKQLETTKKSNDDARYEMNTGFAITNAKVSDILANMVDYSFLPMDDNAKKNLKVRKLLWNYIWETSSTDREIFKIVMDAMKYGSGWGYEYIKKEQRELNTPIVTDNGFEFKKEMTVDYDDCYLEHIPWENIYVNSTSVEDSTECIIVRHWERDEFISKFGSNPMYSNVSEGSIPPGKRYYNLTQSDLVDEQNYSIVFNPSTMRREDDKIVSVLQYYNKSRDEFIVIANGVWINPIAGDKVMPIPFIHKELPIVCFVDHYIEDDAYGMGEFDITEGSRNLKNAVRSLSIEVIKAQFGFTTISPSADFEEATLQLGLRNFARVDKEDIGFYAPNINGQSLQVLEQKVDEDIIIETGVDFRSMLISQTETASRTNQRTQSAQKRINLNLKLNAYNFFKRLAKLRMSNIEFYYEGKSPTISVKGMDIKENGDVRVINGGYGTFTIKPEYIKGKMNILPIMDSLINNTTESMKQKYIEFVQLVSNMVDPDTGKPLVNPKNIIEAGRGIIDDSVDIDRLLEKEVQKKSPEEILKEAGLSGESSDMMGMMNQEPGFIPPEQRSGRPMILPSQTATE